MIPKMTIQEEANLIIADIFGNDYANRGHVINDLCEDNGIAYDPDLNGDEINELIVNNEDTIRIMYADYLYTLKG